MDRREMLVGAGAVGLAALGGGGALAQQETSGGGRGNIHKRCAEDCTDCEKECNWGFHHCYKQVQAGKQDYAKAMHLCVDCGDICSTAGKLVARMSPLMTHTCRACAECCDACVAACEQLNDREMKEVIESLRKCAKSCREMVQAMGGR
jgi:hypothetical protein